MRVIVNADDLGASSNVNSKIFLAMDHGVITSATLLANGPAFAEALERIPKYRTQSFGLHLNLTEFEPVAPTVALQPLLDANGVFNGNLRTTRITADLRRAIYRELYAQADKVVQSGHVISHIDSHHHVHTVPALFSVLKRLQRDFNITKVRISKNVYSKISPANYTRLLKKVSWNLALRLIGRTKTTEAFTSFIDFLEITKYRTLNHSSIELMTHPGNPDFEEETAKLHGTWREQFSQQFQLISYNEL